MSDRRFVQLIVRGRVQGVGFRAFVEDEASRRGLDGWVRNRRDGTVEVAAGGPGDAVGAWVEALRRGPPASRVDRLDLSEADEASMDGLAGFTVLPTV